MTSKNYEWNKQYKNIVTQRRSMSKGYRWKAPRSVYNEALSLYQVSTMPHLGRWLSMNKHKKRQSQQYLRRT